MESQEQRNEFGSRVFQQFMTLFVTPEVSKRQEAGELEKPLNLRAAQILFFSDGRRPQVRINSEVRAISKVKFKSGISKKAGEPIYEHELEGLDEINLTKEDDPDCGHATLIRIGDRWTIAFDFRYNTELSKKHIKVAEEFCQAAEYSLSQKNWIAFIDNLFSATELLARSILLSIPDPKFRKKSTHTCIQIRYNRFADMGNVEKTSRETLNKLSGLRDQTRYLKADILITEDESIELFENVKSMLEYASANIGIR